MTEKNDSEFTSGCGAGIVAALVIVALSFSFGICVGRTIEQHKANQAGVGEWKSTSWFGWDYQYKKEKSND